jgi:UDPglucose 6-dehydrogenase
MNSNISSKEQNISIIGVGKLGLCTALIFERAGFNVLGVDVFPDYVKRLNNKDFKSSEPFVEDYLKTSKNFRATLSIDEALEFSDTIFILVATPTGNGEKSYDHTHLGRVLNEINKRKVSNKHIVIGCTVLPGYINNVARDILTDCKDVTVNYNPEFIAQGSIIKNFESPDMILIGEQTKAAGDCLEKIYRKVFASHEVNKGVEPNFCRMTAESAEITKLSVNCFITTKIAFANTIKDISDRTPNSSADDILDAIGLDTRVGGKCLKPGYGFGGPCFPRDNRALGNYAKSVGVEPIIPRATDASNKNHASIMIENFLKEGKDEYVFEEVAYKEKCPVNIIEESQKLEVAKRIARTGKKVTIRDRLDIIESVKIEYGSLFNYEVL